MNCNCLNEIDNKLRERNLKLNCLAFTFPDFRTMVSLPCEWVDRDKAPKGKKRNPPGMFASHCPFCGKEVEKV